MATITRKTTAPDHEVLTAIANFVRTKAKKATVDAQGNTVTVRQKVLWQKQEAVFEVQDGTLTASGNCQDSDALVYRTVEEIMPMLFDHGWLAAAETHGNDFMRKDSKARDKVLSELFPHETVSIAVPGFYDDKNTVVAATDQRIILIAKEILGWDGSTQTIALDKISGISEDHGLVFASIRISTSNDKIEVEKVAKPEAKTFVSVVRNALAAPAAPSTPAPAPEQPDRMAELKNLAELHAAGVLTDEEFTAAKARILGI